MGTFNFVGTLASIKDTDKFQAYSETSYDSGWMNHRLVFKVNAGDNDHFVEINGGKWKDDKKNSVKTRSRKTDDKPSENITIDWDKRFDPAEIDKVAAWKLLTLDFEKYSVRKALKDANNEAALAESKKKRHRYLAGIDYIDAVKELLHNEDYKDKKFVVRGNVNITYSSNKDRYYSAYEVTSIYLAEDDAAPESTVDFEIAFTSKSFEKQSDTLAIINGYTPFYDSTTKKNWFSPMPIVVRANEDDEKGKKKIEGLAMRMNISDDVVKTFTAKCEKIHGSTRRAITFDDLPESVKEDIEFGLISEEDAIRDAGGSAYGDKIEEIRFVSFGKASNAKSNEIRGITDSAYPVSYLTEKPHVESNDDDDDLFD